MPLNSSHFPFHLNVFIQHGNTFQDPFGYLGTLTSN